MGNIDDIRRTATRLALWPLVLASLSACVTARSGEAPLRLEKGHVFVQARLEGQGPFVFALDTGSEATIVSSEVAAKLGLSGGDRAVISAVGGSRITRSDSVRNVEVGTARMSALPVLIGASNAGSNVDGILGCSFFKAFRVTIDYARLLVTFTAP